MKKIIGITGGIAGGKSTVTNYLRKLGYFVIDADEIAHDNMRINTVGYQGVVETFGSIYLQDNLEINRSLLGNLIFNNKEAKDKLNQIIHPIVKQKILELIEKNEGLIFIDVPLLYEAGYESLCHEIIVISIDEKMQINRLIKRDNIDEVDARKKIIAQMPLKEKLGKADFVIDNNYSLSNTYEQIEKILEKLKEQ